jgi:hypothetical protein
MVESRDQGECGQIPTITLLFRSDLQTVYLDFPKMALLELRVQARDHTPHASFYIREPNVNAVEHKQK